MEGETSRKELKTSLTSFSFPCLSTTVQTSYVTLFMREMACLTILLIVSQSSLGHFVGVYSLENPYATFVPILSSFELNPYLLEGDPVTRSLNSDKT